MTDPTTKLSRAWLMYLGDCEETETTPTLEGEDGFAAYLITLGSMGIDLTMALHNESHQIIETFGGAVASAAFDQGYRHAYAELDDFLDEESAAGDCCGHLNHQHNEDGGCTICECRAWEL